MENPNFYAIIPANVRYSDIKPNAKLLYGEITALTNQTGFCYATNDYFAKLYKVSKKQVSLWISELKDKGFITYKIDVVNGYTKRFIAIHQKVITPPPKGNDIYKYNNTINNSFLLSHEENIKEEKKDEFIFCETIEEFREFLNKGILEEKYPWKNFESTSTDCFLFYETSGKKIKKTSAQAIMCRWITGGDPKKREEEEKAWKESQRKKQYIQEDPEKKEREENFKKQEQAKKYLSDNPTELSRIQKLAYDRALVLVKGKENLVKPLLNGLMLKIAFEESEKKNTLVSK